MLKYNLFHSLLVTLFFICKCHKFSLMKKKMPFYIRKLVISLKFFYKYLLYIIIYLIGKNYILQNIIGNEISVPVVTVITDFLKTKSYQSFLISVRILQEWQTLFCN